MSPARASVFVTFLLVSALAWAWRHGVTPTLPRVAVPEWPKIAALFRALASVALVDLAALGVTAPLAVTLPAAGRLRRATIRLALGLALLGTALGALGVAGMFSRAALLVTLAVCALPGLAVAWDLTRAWRASPLSRGGRALLLVTAAACALPALHALYPAYGWDALTYHLALPDAFVREGRIALDPRSVYTAFPLLAEALYGAGIALDGPAVAKLLHLQFGALATLLLADIARERAPRGWWLAPTAVALDPTFLWEATVVYNDLALALFAVALLDALAATRADNARGAAARAAIFAGACVATRYPGALVPVAFSAPFLLDGAVARERRVRLALTLAGGSALLAPWITRNLLGGGGPLGLGVLHPLFLAQMRAFNASIGWGRDLVSLVLAPFRLVFTDHPERYTGGYGYLLGPLHLAGALGLFLRPIPGVAPRMGVAVGVFFLGWFASVQESRYLLPLLPLLALSSACALDAALEHGARWRRGVTLAGVAVAACSVLSMASAGYRHVVPVALGRVRPERVARLDVAERVGDRLRAELPPGARVLPLFESRAWHLRGVSAPYFHVNQGAPLWAELHDARVRRGLCAWVARERFTHVLVNLPAYRASPPYAAPGYRDADIMADMRAALSLLRGSAELWFEDAGVQVWRLRAGACAEP